MSLLHKHLTPVLPGYEKLFSVFDESLQWMKKNGTTQLKLAKEVATPGGKAKLVARVNMSKAGKVEVYLRTPQGLGVLLHFKEKAEQEWELYRVLTDDPVTFSETPDSEFWYTTVKPSVLGDHGRIAAFARAKGVHFENTLVRPL